jgi:hypothetical protein
MSSTQNSIRLETLLALSLSNEWTHVEEETDKPETRANERELPSELQSLGESDKRDCLNLLGRLNKLTSEDQERWVAQRITNIRASTPERNRRMIEGIHPGQIAEALREEPARIQQLILNSLPRSLAKVVEQTLQPQARFHAKDLELAPELVESIRLAFFARFVATESLINQTPLDLLSGVELARLIRLLGVRETAIACRGITAVETVTAFLKRFSAEDAYAIVSHLAVLQDVDDERVRFAEQLARMALGNDFDEGSAMLDRVGLSLLAIALREGGTKRHHHTAQKLPVAAARELQELVLSDRIQSEPTLTVQIVEEVESLAAYLHRDPSSQKGEQRGEPAI